MKFPKLPFSSEEAHLAVWLLIYVLAVAVLIQVVNL
jgi:hypothetical protein